MKLLKNLIYVSLVTLVIINTGCKKDSEPENQADFVAAKFQGVFSEEIGICNVQANATGVVARVNMNGQVIELVSDQTLEKGKSLTLQNQDIQLTISADANELLAVEVLTSFNTYKVVGFKSEQAETFMGVVDENIGGTMKIGLFNFIVEADKAKGLIYFEGVDTEPMTLEGSVLNSSETQLYLEMERNGVVEEVLVELVKTFGKTNSEGLNVTAMPVTISTSNVGTNVNVGTLILGFNDFFAPPYDTIEITQAKLTSLGGYGGDATGRFHKLSFASSVPLWNGSSFYDEGIFMDLIFSTSSNQVNNIEGVYNNWSVFNPTITNKQLVPDYAADSLFFQENLYKATTYIYYSNKITDLNISRVGLNYTVSCDVVYSYPRDIYGNLFGIPERSVKFNYTGTIDLY